MKVRTEKQKGVITLWDDGSGIGLRFQEGESLQRYTAQVVLKDTEKGVEEIERVSNLLTEEAATLYPYEFAPLQDPE